MPTAAPRTTEEAVREALREAIMSGQLPAGSRLVQENIAADLGVSRVPVREALLQLASEGLVAMEAHKGARVAWLSPAEVAEIFTLRVLLVKHAVRLAVPNLTAEQLRRLRKIALTQHTRADLTTRRRTNRAFYATLFENLDSPRLLDMLHKLEGEAGRYLPALDRPLMGHAELVDACSRRDGREAAKLVGKHLEHIRQLVIEKLDDVRPSEPPNVLRGEASAWR